MTGPKVSASSAYAEAVNRILRVEGEGVTPRQAYAALGVGALGSLRHVLREMVAAGEARCEGESGRRRYWRVAP